MKTIQPVSIWFNGEVKQATILDAYVVNLQLGSSATFLYTLAAVGIGPIATGNIVMTGTDYQNWDQDSFAWDWVANKLGLVITGDVQNQGA
jgi:hypothetical protein